MSSERPPLRRRQREAVVAALDEKLAEQGSWCGETHLQKSVLFLQDLLGVPTDFQYILYKYGPFSRELREELALMRGNGFLQLVPQPAPYGPTLQVTDIARAQLIGRWPKTLKRYQRELDFVAKHLGGLGVGELEKLATALWVRTNEPDVPLEEHAEDINNLKPHVSKAQALDALRQVEKMEHEASELLAS